MEVQIHIHNTDLVDALQEYVERRLRFSLRRFVGRLGRVRVRVTDVNGPRGGVDKSCRVSAEMLPSGKLVLQEAVDANLYVAVDHATERIGRSVGRQVERDREVSGDSVRKLQPS